MASFLDILKDGVKGAVDIRLEQERAEIEGERSEGAAEFANPQTISQPVRHSQLPTGQPLNFNTVDFISRNQLLIIGVLGFILLLLLIIRMGK